jgi:aminoglycoside phosphotransferase (APT) family kinase protein
MGAEVEFAEDNFIRSTKHVNHARVLAKTIAPQLQTIFPSLFSQVPFVQAITEQGWYNLTLLVGTSSSNPEYILRLAATSPPLAGKTSSSLPHLEKERYILSRLSHLDLTAKLVAPGTGKCHVHIPGRGDVEYAFLLQTRLPFQSAKQFGETIDRGRILWQLGEHLRTIQQQTMSGFGSEFDEATQSFACRDHQDLIRTYLHTIEQSPADRSMKRWLVARTEGLMQLSPDPRLSHRDLLGNLGNVLVDEAGNVRGIIDWEFASSGLALHSELAAFIYVQHRDGKTQEQIESDRSAVLGGFGITERDYRAHYERDVETIVLNLSLTALIKFEVLCQKGGVEREPWRELFAKRAGKLCSECFSKDGALSSGRVRRRVRGEL